MTKLTTIRSWALAVLAVLALGACNRDWDTGRSVPAAAGSAATATATSQDAMGMAPAAGWQGQQAGAAGERAAFAALPDRGDLVGYPKDRVVRREGAYTWHRTDVSEAHALRAIFDGELRITAPDGQLLAFEYERHVEHPTGDWTWIGRLRDAPPGRQAILTFGAKAVFGSIAQSAAAPLRLAMRDGASWLVETDPALLAGVESRVLRPDSPDFLLPPADLGSLAGPKASGDTVNPSGAPVESSSSATTSATTVVDVLVGYTPGFASAQGGDSQARTRINFLIAVSNQAYINSQIDARVRLVHAMQVSYPDATENGEALQQLTGYDTSRTGEDRYVAPDSRFSSLRAARDAYGADLVTLVRKFSNPENDGCGIAWLIGGGLQTIHQGYEYFGYSVVSDGIDPGEDGKNYYCRDETMVHEFGHNMGSAHDIETAKDDDGVLDNPDDYGRYTYSFGHKTGAGSGDFYTIMAYGDKRESGPSQTAYRVFSNPSITYCGGYTCGTSNADNARSLRQTIPTIAAFRTTLVADHARNDVNGDGRSDLLWHNKSTGYFAYWTMSGRNLLQSKTVFVGTPFTVIGSGDYNGDGLVDILWQDTARRVYMWLGDGVGFKSGYVQTYGSAWLPVGSADVDGDGRTDLLWHNKSTGYFAYWLMNGRTLLASKVQFVGTPFTVIGHGDYNGDGLADILWQDTARRVYMWLGDGVGFKSGYVQTYGSAWLPVGSADVDGDGRTDLLWHNKSTGYFAYWLMNGRTLLASKVQFVGTPFTVIGYGDYNGDGLADILWQDTARRVYMWLGDGTDFKSGYVKTYAQNWAPVNLSP